jgi:hypothetical protein
MPEGPDWSAEVDAHAGADAEAGADELALGERARLPRWLYGAGGLLVAAVVAGSVLAATHGGSPTPSTSSSATPAAGGGPGPGQALALSGDADDAVLVGGQLFRLGSDGLYRYKVDDAAILQGDGVLPISGLDALDPANSYRLAVDPPAHLIWVIGMGTSPSSVLAVDTRTMSVVLRTQQPQPIQDAAALGGHLYLVSENAVVDVARGGAVTQLRALTDYYLSVAADPARDRLLLFDAGTDRATAYTPSTRTIRSGPKLPMGKGDLAVDGAGDIWAGGYGSLAVLVRLDPRTLAPLTRSPLAAQLGPGAQLVAAGRSVVWVRSGAGGTDLWCVAGATGREEQRWSVAGAVTSSSGLAFADSGGTVRPLSLHGCRG